MKIWVIRRYKNISKPFYTLEEAYNEIKNNVYMRNHPDIKVLEISLDIDKLKH